MKPTARIVYYNNKSRKGAHVYVKAQGFPAGIYKLNADTPLDTYILYYIDKHRKRPKGSLKRYKQAFDPKQNLKVSKSLKNFFYRYTKKVGKRPTLESSFEHGISSTVLPDAFTATEQTIRDAYRQVLSPLVLDKKLLNIFTLEENIQRIKQRFEYQCTLKDSNNNTIMTHVHMKEKTLREVIHILASNYRKGMTWKDIYPIKRKLGLIRFSSEQGTSKEPLNSISIQLIFRR